MFTQSHTAGTHQEAHVMPAKSTILSPIAVLNTAWKLYMGLCQVLFYSTVIKSAARRTVVLLQHLLYVHGSACEEEKLG